MRSTVLDRTGKAILVVFAGLAPAADGEGSFFDEGAAANWGSCEVFSLLYTPMGTFDFRPFSEFEATIGAAEERFLCGSTPTVRLGMLGAGAGGDCETHATALLC